MAPNISVFKYPLGVIRIVEFIFIVIAIAAVNSWSVQVSFSCPDGSNKTVSIDAHSFTLSNQKVVDCKGAESHFWNTDNNAGGSAGFFYFTNVTALIYVLLITFVYVIFWDLYQNEKRLALADLGITALLFIFFFFCSSVWWAGSNTMGRATSEEVVTNMMKADNFYGNLPQESSKLRIDTNNGKLAVSVICDWVCVLLFAFNCWFVWKEVVPRQVENPSQIA